MSLNNTIPKAVYVTVRSKVQFAVTLIRMADLQEKKMRSLALSNFTRSTNKLEEVINDSSPLVIVTPQYNKVMQCWEKLETAHDEFIEKTEIEDIDNDPQGFKYLDAPGARHVEIMKVYSDYLKDGEKKEEENRQQKETADRNLEEERSRRELQESQKNKAAEKELEMNTMFTSADAELRSMINDSMIQMCEC